MDRTERFYRIDQLLHEHRVVPLLARIRARIDEGDHALAEVEVLAPRMLRARVHAAHLAGAQCNA